MISAKIFRLTTWSVMAVATPIRRSPRLLARLLSQPATLQPPGITTTPTRSKRSLQHDCATSQEQEPASKKLRLIDSSMVATVVNSFDHSLDLNYDQCIHEGNAILIVTKKKLHHHPPAGYISRLRVVLDNSGDYQLQVCKIIKNTIANYCGHNNCYYTIRFCLIP